MTSIQIEVYARRFLLCIVLFFCVVLATFAAYSPRLTRPAGYALALSLEEAPRTSSAAQPEEGGIDTALIYAIRRRGNDAP